MFDYVKLMIDFDQLVQMKVKGWKINFIYYVIYYLIFNIFVINIVVVGIDKYLGF